ncbi:DNA cytosine methyltransferase [Desulfurococcaceae archaeon MEX13E-LK6-19]|nr:DNA cytosine methyltransferase [Desulfurococcaceae archaeon MEX13E-LK6-19]
MKPKYKIIDLFCGAGGFSLGFKLSGRYKHLLAIDNLPAAAKTYKMNFPETLVLAEDIKDISGRLIQELVGEDIDVVIGSPPCEPFTGSNPRREKNPLDRLYKDPIGQLTLHFIRIVSDIKPRVFVMENVPAIMDDGLEKALRREFRQAGYSHIYFNVLKAEDYGTPSHRLRVFISNIKISPPRLGKYITVKEALKGLPPEGGHLPNHEIPPLSDRKLRRISRLKWGQALIYYEGAKRRLPNLIRLDPNKIAPTVLGSSRFIHPFYDRFLTVREQARLMGFPDSFVFLGGRDEQYNQVGEAVPVPLAKAVALEVARKLDSGDI